MTAAGFGALAPSAAPGPPQVSLRPYQQAARQAVQAEWAAGRARTLLVLPTGTGKTVVFARIAEDCVRAGQRVLILAHRGELLAQAAEKLRAVTGLCCAVEQAQHSSLGALQRVVVGSVQSLCQPGRLAGFDSGRFGAIIIDEAHHAISDSYLRILEHFPDARVLGVTATPDRNDMQNLGAVFDSLAYEYSLPRAIADGYLCPIRALTIPLKLDIGGVAVTAGDFSAGQLGSALDPYLEQIAAEMASVCAKRRTVVFLPLVDTSKKFRDILAAHGLRAAEVNGSSPDRAEVLAGFSAGEYDVLCNAMLLTEGWDCPAVDCIAVLRPTKSRALYSQMVGRGTRLCPQTGKKDLLLLDFLWLTERHELCRPADLVCTDRAVAKQMTEDLAAAGGPVELEEAEQRAASEVLAQREEALAKQLEAMRRRKKRLVDPLQYQMSILAEDLAGYVPSFGWEAAPPSAAQAEALEHRGIDPDGVPSAGLAQKLLDRLAQRTDAGLTTPKQIRFLEQKGFEHVGTWQFAQAKRMIDRIAANGWRLPYGLEPKGYRPESIPDQG